MNEEDVRREFGKWLTNEMDRLNLNAEELGRRMKVSGSTVRAWKDGSRHIKATSCDDLADVLGLDRNEVRRRAGRHEVQVDRSVTWNVEAHASQGQTASVDDDRVTVYTHVQNDPDLTDHEKRFILDALDRARRRRREIEAFERERGGNG